MEGEHYVYLRKIQQKVFFLKTDPEKEIVSEDPDYYKAMEDKEDEGKYIFILRVSQ